MKKTASVIEDDIYVIISASPLKSAVTGEVYKEGLRPSDSDKEDVVVTFVTGADGQVQEGVVTVDIYVPDIDYGAVRKVRHIARCRELEMIADEFASNLSDDDYWFSLNEMIRTSKAENISQHFVQVRLAFKRLNEQD